MTPSDDRPPRSPAWEELDEVDPTGIRDLLRSLPEPGPMPDELVRRIETRLAVELAHRQPAPYGEHAEAPHGGRVVDLSSERTRRRPGRPVLILGAAAAGLLVATLAMSDLLGSGVVGGADTAAYAPASGSEGGSDSDDTAGGAADEEAGEGAQDRGAAGGDTASAEDDSGGGAAGGAPEAAGDGVVGAEVVVLPHLGVLDVTLLEERVGDLVAAPNPMEASPNLSAAQAKSCWTSVPDADSWTDRYAATATVGAEAAVVLWARQGDGDAHAWVLPAECTVDPGVEPLADAALPG